MIVDVRVYIPSIVDVLVHKGSDLASCSRYTTLDYEIYYEILYVPFTTPYSKPSVCMYSNSITYVTVITPSIAGVSLKK